MEKTRFKIGVLDIVCLLVSLIFLLGIIFVFGPCDPKEDGGFMNCHWAGNTLTGLAAVLTAISLMLLFVRESQTKLGLSLAVIPVAILACLIPGRLISLCMMQEMRCRAVMTPAVIACNVPLIVAAIFNVITQWKRTDRSKVQNWNDAEAEE